MGSRCRRIWLDALVFFFLGGGDTVSDAAVRLVKERKGGRGRMDLEGMVNDRSTTGQREGRTGQSNGEEDWSTSKDWSGSSGSDALEMRSGRHAGPPSPRSCSALASAPSPP